MPTSTLTLKNFVNHGLHPSFIRQIPEELSQAYEEACREGELSTFSQDGQVRSRLLPPIDLELLSHAQGLWAQQYLHNFASGLSGVIATFAENTRHRAHVEIRTDYARLTSHRVRYPGDFPRYAVYRETNASDNQCWLIEPPALESKTTTGQVYLYLLHGPSITDPTRLGFVQIGAPCPTGKSYIALIDLYKHEDFLIVHQENIPDNAVITLKTTMLPKMGKSDASNEI